MPEPIGQQTSGSPGRPAVIACGICDTRRQVHENGDLPAGWYQSPADPDWRACPDCVTGLLEAARAGRIFALPSDEAAGA
ncbi:MAG: hypothetical protein HY910_08770 [Desulfarculus sp.]|nr:hypothetical protein [Desulfarculus sp.]